MATNISTGVRTPVLIFVAMMISGYSAGTKLQICGYLTSRFAGLRNYGAIFGFMGSLIAIGGALGPFSAGLIYDHTGSYDAFVIIGMIGCFIAGLLILSLPRYPDFRAAVSEASHAGTALPEEAGSGHASTSSA